MSRSGKKTASIRELRIEEIRREEEMQPRERLDRGIIDSYADDIANGAEMPPVTVFSDGSQHWLADGYHRVAAFEKLGNLSVKCEVHQGSRRDAVLSSFGANASHGVRRSNADKRRAIIRMLSDAEWGKWSSTEIAKKCSVSHTLVSNLREEQFGDREDDPSGETRKCVRNGQEIAQKIGDRARKKVKLGEGIINATGEPNRPGLAPAGSATNAAESPSPPPIDPSDEPAAGSRGSRAGEIEKVKRQRVYRADAPRPEAYEDREGNEVAPELYPVWREVGSYQNIATELRNASSMRLSQFRELLKVGQRLKHGPTIGIATAKIREVEKEIERDIDEVLSLRPAYVQGSDWYSEFEMNND